MEQNNHRRQLIFTPAEDNETGWVVTVPSLPGCHTQGDTLAEAADHIVEAMEVYIETLEAKGWEVPPPFDVIEKMEAMKAWAAPFTRNWEDMDDHWMLDEAGDAVRVKPSESYTVPTTYVDGGRGKLHIATEEE